MTPKSVNPSTPRVQDRKKSVRYPSMAIWFVIVGSVLILPNSSHAQEALPRIDPSTLAEECGDNVWHAAAEFVRVATGPGSSRPDGACPSQLTALRRLSAFPPTTPSQVIAFYNVARDYATCFRAAIPRPRRGAGPNAEEAQFGSRLAALEFPLQEIRGALLHTNGSCRSSVCGSRQDTPGAGTTHAP